MTYRSLAVETAMVADVVRQPLEKSEVQSGSQSLSDSLRARYS